MTIRDALTISHAITLFYKRLDEKYDGTEDRMSDYCVRFPYANRDRYLSYEYNEKTEMCSISLRDSNGSLVGPALASRSFDDLYEQLSAVSEASFVNIEEEGY